VLLDELPEIVTPCLPPFPVGLQDQQTRMRRRHVDFLVNPSTASLIRLRSTIVQFVRQFLLDDSQLEVQTPILAGEAGGATARPFQTVASEFTDRKLTLRIAPELWLKRLAVGGFDRVFEIGPCFRNEGMLGVKYICAC
jgi:lysyl-tRNA synthetase class 2